MKAKKHEPDTSTNTCKNAYTPTPSYIYCIYQHTHTHTHIYIYIIYFLVTVIKLVDSVLLVTLALLYMSALCMSQCAHIVLITFTFQYVLLRTIHHQESDDSANMISFEMWTINWTKCSRGQHKAHVPTLFTPVIILPCK